MLKIIKTYILNRKINKALRIASNIIYSESFIIESSSESKPILDDIVSRSNWERRLILNYMLRAVTKDIMEFSASKLERAKADTIVELNSMRSKLKLYGLSEFDGLLPLYFDKEEAMTSIEFLFAKTYLKRMRESALNNPYSYEGMCFRTQMAKRQSLTAIEKAQLKGKAAEIEALENRISEIEKR